MDESSPGDVGKRRAYVVLMVCGVVAAIVRLTQTPSYARTTQIHMAVILVLCALFLVGLRSRHFSMRWADRFVYAAVVYALLFPLVAWHLGVTWPDVASDVLAVLLWTFLLLLLAFVVFGTRGGVVASVTSVVVLAALVIPIVWSASLGESTSYVQDAALRLAFVYPAAIALLWLLSRRLEMLTRIHARADLLAEEATTDVLTGVANRRLLTDRLDLRIADARRYGRELSVVFIDLDELKQINDTYGHGVGDHVLVELATRLSATVRESDVVGRWGGDEFLVIAAECAADEADELARRCRDAIRGNRFADVGTVAASFGVATLSADDDRRTLLRRADLALYTAKNEGRDCVVAVDTIDRCDPLAAPRRQSG